MRGGQGNMPGQGLLSALEASFPLHPHCTDNELPASTIAGTITTHHPRGHSPVKMLTVPGIEARGKLLTALQLLIINPSPPQLPACWHSTAPQLQRSQGNSIGIQTAVRLIYKVSPLHLVQRRATQRRTSAAEACIKVIISSKGNPQREEDKGR